MANDYSLETRCRKLIYETLEAGDRPSCLVMGPSTWHSLLGEMQGDWISNGYFWTNGVAGTRLDWQADSTTFLGVLILVKDYVADGEVIVGV